MKEIQDFKSELDWFSVYQLEFEIAQLQAIMHVKSNLTDTNFQYYGRAGDVVCKVKDSFVDGERRRIFTYYIVQFKSPYKWSFFKRNEFRKVKESEEVKDETSQNRS
ncbi:hypothetical protein DRN73_08210 [Candidatus Pacearchaeota archaeon]|nr:MAG: hypothetical protein DRN73_08210 [Candidatus Pacearchaeota archaeon]